MAVLTQDVKNVAADYFAALDTPVSLSCEIQLRYGELPSLIQRTVNPNQYASADAYLRDASAVAFLKKLNCNLGLNPKAAASVTWDACEKKCYEVNRRLCDSFTGDDYHAIPNDPRFDNFVIRLRRTIMSLIGLGPANPKGKLGPGTTMSDAYGCTNVINKFTSHPTLADHSLGLLSVFNDAWARHIDVSATPIDLVRCNQYFTVPKTALTDRPCAKEPSLNVYFQLGLGKQLRSCLLRNGIDLSQGQVLHQELARQGSLYGDYATIDLSSASDTIAHGLVKLMLPPRWYAALDQTRSRRTSKDGRTILLEKFSSMGNGFTFELETILFFGIVCSVSDDLIPGVNVHVYGDDIIVPTEYFSEVVAALRYWGFTPNPAKTFCESAFRESCGGDFFGGEDVRPIYLKELPHEPQQYISLHNQLVRHSRRFTDDRTQLAFGVMCDRLRASVPSGISNCRGPSGLGDICFHLDELRWRYKWEHSIRYMRSYVPFPKRGASFTSFAASAQIAAALYGLVLMEEDYVPSPITGYRLSWTAWS